jgi:phosphoribosyl-ATP pyrophosphohydrolase
MSDFTVEALAGIVAARASSDDPGSYTAELVRAGLPKCAKKLGEEAVEAAIAAVSGDREGLKAEAADVLYHLLVLLHAAGVSFDEVKAELARRTARSGLEEKAARGAGA